MVYVCVSARARRKQSECVFVCACVCVSGFVYLCACDCVCACMYDTTPPPNPTTSDRPLQQNHWCWSVEAELRQHQDIVPGSNQSEDGRVINCIRNHTHINYFLMFHSVLLSGWPSQSQSIHHTYISSRLDYCNFLYLGLSQDNVSCFQPVQDLAAKTL